VNASPLASSGSVPHGYREAFRWNISQLGSRMILVQLWTGFFFFFGLAVFLLVAIGLGRIDWGRGLETAGQIMGFPYRMGVEIARQLAGASSGAGLGLAWQALKTILLVVGTILGLQILTVFLHEGAHGLAMKGFGARPQFGFLPGQAMFFATSPGHAYRRAEYFWVSVAPLIGLDVIYFLILLFPVGVVGSAILAVLAALNTGGAMGDLWILSVLRKFPPQAYIIDEKDGMRVFLPEEDCTSR
jgi:hypothetical protein